MPTYTGFANFSTSGGSAAYRLNVTVTTTQVTGGTNLVISATATQFRFDGVSPAFSSNGNRTYNVPGGRLTSVTGTLRTFDSLSWTYDFRSSSTQTVWGGFNRYIPYSHGSSTSVTITAAGSGSIFLGSASVSLSIPLFSQPAPTPPPVTTYTLSYNSNGGSPTPSSQTLSSGATFTAAAAPTRSGFTFSHWLGNNGISYSPGFSYSMPSFNLNLTAQWISTTYTLSYNSNGGSPTPSSQTLSFGATFTAAAAPTRSGFTFSHWLGSNGAFYSPGFSYSMPESNLSLTAQWTSASPVFSDSSITTAWPLGRNYSAAPDRTVTASPVTGYSIIYSGNGLNPTGWLSINSFGQLSGVPPQMGAYTFRIRATNETTSTDTSTFTLNILPPGRRFTGTSTSTSLTLAKRFDGTNWIDLRIMRRFDGTTWRDISNL